MNHVDARFAGQDVRFRIPRSRLDAAEAVGSSLYERMRRIADGRWKVADIRQTLQLAWPGRQDFSGNGPIDRAIAERAPATYAPLALLILAAALSGLPDGTGVFSDEDE